MFEIFLKNLKFIFLPNKPLQTSSNILTLKDNVSGFTIKQVEDQVKDSKSCGEVKQKFETNYGQNGLFASKFLGLWQ